MGFGGLSRSSGEDWGREVMEKGRRRLGWTWRWRGRILWGERGKSRQVRRRKDIIMSVGLMNIDVSFEIW